MQPENLEKLDISDFAIGRLVDTRVLGQLGAEGILNHVERTPEGTLLRSVAVALVDAPLDKVVDQVQQIRTQRGGFLRDLAARMLGGPAPELPMAVDIVDADSTCPPPGPESVVLSIEEDSLALQWR